MRQQIAVEGVINYLDPAHVTAPTGKLEFYSEDVSRTNLVLRSVTVPIRDARPLRHELSLEREGFVLADHKSAIADFEDAEEVRRVYGSEIEHLIQDLTGAAVVRVAPNFLLRFGEGSPKSGSRVNSRPARFVHSDYSAKSAREFAHTRFFSDGELKPGGRFAAFNIWRVISAPPQDIPLAVCDARTLAAQDRVLADSVIDAPGAPEFRFESTVFLHNPAHRWSYFRDMTRDEALIFRAFDTDGSRPQFVAHTGFNDPGCPPGVPTRASIEARAFAYFRRDDSTRQ